MCFSATACFSAGTVLVPAGLYCLTRAYKGDKRFLAFAAFPLLFGLQQIIEGILWIALENQSDFGVQAAGTAYLLFAYFLWPFFVPLSALLVETSTLRKNVFLIFSGVGFVFGASLYMPLLFTPDWLSVTTVKDSILYSPTLVYDEMVSRTTVRVFYACIVAVPLLFSSIKTVRHFGILIFLSVVLSAIYFRYAFVSVWCFFAAILSAYVIYLIHRETQVR